MAGLRLRTLAGLLTIALLFSPATPIQAKHPPPIHGAGLYRITAYLWTGYRTATGVWPFYGGVAVDPRVVPLGSHVHISGVGTFVANDTGGAVFGRHLDVFALNMTQAYAIQGTGYRQAYWTN